MSSREKHNYLDFLIIMHFTLELSDLGISGGSAVRAYILAVEKHLKWSWVSNFTSPSQGPK